MAGGGCVAGVLASPRSIRDLLSADRESLLRLLALATLLGLAAFVLFYRLRAASWTDDELGYRRAGYEYFNGSFSLNPEHPFLAKYILGAAQLVAGNNDEVTLRTPAAIAGLLTGVALMLFASREAGFVAGLITFALWSLIPHAAGFVTPFRIERFGLLDPFMVAFMSGALLAGWQWYRSGRWRWALIAGFLAGCAAASKPPGIFVLPSLLAIAVLKRSRAVAAQASAAVAACAITAVATYLPVIGTAGHRIHEMFEFQTSHGGSPILVAGKPYLDPPWWATLWFHWHNVGPVASVCLVALAVVSPFLLDRRLVVYLGTALTGPFVYLAFVSNKVIEHYYYIYVAPLTLLAGLSLHALLRRPGWYRIVGAGTLAVLFGVAGKMLVDLGHFDGSGYAPVAKTLRREGLDRANVVVIGKAFVLRNYLPRALVGGAPDRRTDAVVVDPRDALRAQNPEARWLGDPRATALYLHGHRASYRFRVVGGLRLYTKRAHTRLSP
ncbi:MAG: ArnT family glycosyltransferase [Thermoleophilaceae bacterium]